MYSFGALVPELRPYAEALEATLVAAGLNPQVTSVVRSYATQKKLYDNYRQGRSKYPAAPPGYSAHEQGWAFDLQLNDASYYADAGAVWESWGGTWGGRFSDPIHFEMGGASAYLKALLDGGWDPPQYAGSPAVQPAPAAPAPEASPSIYDKAPGPIQTALIDAAAIGNKIIDWVW
jgi:hypothetical protein